MPRAPSSDRSLTLNARLADFSSWPSLRCPPVSSPPCAASITTTNLAAGAAGTCGAAGAGGDCCAHARVKHSDIANRTAAAPATIPRVRPLVQCIDREAAQQFGIKICGLLRHHVSSERDFLQLIERDGVGKEGDVCLATAHLVNSLGCVAQVADIGLLAHFFGIQPQ